ncbi:MAG: GspH/FimT family pseudopilin [Pseudomonadota bacterium]
MKAVKGFTLVELMIALTILSVMMAFAVPAFNDFTNQRRMISDVNGLVSAINLARSEAGRRAAEVTVQAVDASDSNDEWGPGYCVTVGDPGDCAASIRTFTLEGNFTFDATADLDGLDSITYTSRGLSEDENTGTIRLCGADADDDPGRVISINAIGRTTVRNLVCFP